VTPLRDDEGTPTRPEGVLQRISAIGAAAQASVPGLYAWMVTVAPAAFARQAGLLAKVASALGLVALLVGILLDRRWGHRARYVSVWGLVLSSALVWVLVPSALGSLRLDEARGIAGMIGWALFAFASAAPLRPRTQIQRGDAIYIAGGVVLAIALQVIGWRVNVPERALLVRLVSIAAGIAIIGAATSISLARHGRAAAAPQRARLRRTLPWLVALVVVGVIGLILMLRS
jgi:hypothetical protein